MQTLLNSNARERVNGVINQSTLIDWPLTKTNVNPLYKKYPQQTPHIPPHIIYKNKKKNALKLHKTMFVKILVSFLFINIIHINNFNNIFESLQSIVKFDLKKVFIYFFCI